MKKALDGIKKPRRQKALIAMDLLSGCMTFGVSTIRGEFDPNTRLGLLLTHGKRFASQQRLRRIQGSRRFLLRRNLEINSNQISH